MRRLLVGVLIGMATLAMLVGPTCAQTPDWREGFRAHDLNNDGRIDRSEFQNWVVDGFYFRDKQHKGYLTETDVQGLMSPERFKAINRKGDGKLTMNEFLNALFQDFAAIDANGNGAITVEEIQTYIKQAGK
jgi:Ca2+-binding EF-hand superfamily protein